MTRRIPVFATLVVLAAVAVMIALGFWQLGRLREKEALIAQARAALDAPQEVAYPPNGRDWDKLVYRRTRATCASVVASTTVAARSAQGGSGIAHRITCRQPGGGPLTVDIGFARDPRQVAWSGGEVLGVVAPGGRIVASDGLVGLAPLARPDPSSIPNNHLSYAVQWFFFAATALVIYALALRKRWRASAA